MVRFILRDLVLRRVAVMRIAYFSVISTTEIRYAPSRRRDSEIGAIVARRRRFIENLFVPPTCDWLSL